MDAYFDHVKNRITKFSTYSQNSIVTNVNDRVDDTFNALSDDQNFDSVNLENDKHETK